MTFSAPRRPIVMLINNVALGPIVTHPRPKNSATIGCIAMTLTELKVRQAFCPPGARPMKCEPHLSAPDEVRRMKQDQENQAFSVWFGTIAAKTTGWVGSAWAFILAVFVIVLWGAAGPYFHYSDTWQLVINTATTVITFLVVFLIQNTQNRNDRALHLKLDEVIRSIRSAHNEMIDIEQLSDAELEQLAKHYHRVREEWELRRANKKPIAS